MEGIFGLLIMLYVVASVVEAVIKRVQTSQIPKPSETVVSNQQEGSKASHVEPNGQIGDIGDSPSMSDVFVFDPHPVEGFDLEPQRPKEQVVPAGLSTASFQAGAPRSRVSRKVEHKSFNIDSVSAQKWREAIVLTEILGKPRGLEPHPLLKRR